MKLTELLLLGVAGWSGLGVLGIILSLLRGRRAEAARHSAWLAGVLGVYLLLVLGVSAAQPQKLLAVGDAQCFGTMCFSITRVDEVPGQVAGDPDRVIRVQVRIENRGQSPAKEGRIEAYLLDSKGREWGPLPGLSGNRLTSRVTGGSQIISQPMFRVATDASGLELAFTHGNWQPRWLLIGDSESLGHQRTLVRLGR